MAKAVGKKKEPNYVEIPTEEWRHALSQAQALEEMVSYSPHALLICPYHSTHRVTATKFESHLAKCRSNYRQQVLARGGMVNTYSCKYNHTHQILPPELFHHEEHCPDRHFVPSYMMYLNPWFEDELDKLNCNLEHHEMDPEELQKMRDGLYLDHFIGSASLTSHGKPIPLEEIKSDTTSDPALLHGYSSPFEWPDFPVGDFRPQQNKKDEKGTVTSQKQEMEGAGGGDSNPGEDQDLDSEEWWKNCNAPKFDYFQSAYNPQRPTHNYPPGLNKSQRRQFVKWNTEWMNRIEQLKAEARTDPAADPLRNASSEQRKRVIRRSVGAELGEGRAPKRTIKRRLRNVQTPYSSENANAPSAGNHQGGQN